MKALVQDTYGSADVLRVADIDIPSIGDDGVLIKVKAASFNPLDWHFMRGAPFVLRFFGGLLKPKQPVRGIDVAGIVETVGSSVSRFQPGDEVFGWCEGAAAEFGAGKERELVAKPANLSFVQAAAIPIAALTALQGLRDQGQVEAGWRVLIIGASGGVGTFAVQIAKELGAEVTGVCSTRNAELVRSIGADQVIDYTAGDFTETEEQYELVFQLAGTASPIRLRRVLAPRGTLVLSSGSGRFSGIDRIVVGKLLGLFVGQRVTTWVASQNQEDLVALTEMVESGRVRPVIDRTFPLADAAEALRYVEEGHTRGKVVVTV